MNINEPRGGDPKSPKINLGVLGWERLGLVLACLAATSLVALTLGPVDGWARGGREVGGGAPRGARSVQAAAPSSVRASRSTATSTSLNKGVSRDLDARRNVNANINVNKDVNVNRNVNRDVDIHHDYHGDYHDDWDNAGAFVAGAVVGGITGAAIASTSQSATVVVTPGTVVTTLPSGCKTLIVNGISYHQCGGVYYRPEYRGGTVVYVVSVP